MSYANPPQGYPPSPEPWPPAGEQGPRHAGGQPPAWTPPQQPSWAQQPTWSPPSQEQPVLPPQLPVRPNWEQAPVHSDWQQTPREIPPPPQRSGFSATYAVLIGVVVLVLGFGAYYLFGRNSGSGFEAKVTKCSASGSVATVGLEVHNRGSDTQTATIRIEYRDGAGKLLDTDTALVRDIGAGDTEDVEQSTILSTNADASMTCRVTGVA